MEREVSAVEQARRLAQLNGVERGLCFGRIDDTDDHTFYIGRIGLHDDEYEPVLIDWRAPAARPFYAATPDDPAGLVRRRHLYPRAHRCRARRRGLRPGQAVPTADRAAWSARPRCWPRVRRRRTGRMSDIVATIQAEQDRIIRSELRRRAGRAGRPGHRQDRGRAAPRRLPALHPPPHSWSAAACWSSARTRPSCATSSQVLPSLGETGVVLSTLGELFPGVERRGRDEPEAAVVKGDLRMAEVLAPRRQRPAAGPGRRLDRFDGVPITAARRDAASGPATGPAASRRPHNVARGCSSRELLERARPGRGRRLGRHLDADDLPYVRAAAAGTERRSGPRSTACGRSLTPQRLLADLLASEEACSRRGRSGCSQRNGGCCARTSRGAGGPSADVPLLDEAAELLGTRTTGATGRPPGRPSARPGGGVRPRACSTSDSDESEPDELVRGRADADAAGDRDAGRRADRRRARRRRPHLDLRPRDRGRGAGAVGDGLAAADAPLPEPVDDDRRRRGADRRPAGATSWGQVLDRYVDGPLAEERLTVNYRTPAEIMAVAADVLASVAPDERAAGLGPRRGRAAARGPGAAAADWPQVAGRVAADLAGPRPKGAGWRSSPRPAGSPSWPRRSPAPSPATGPKSLDSPVALLTVRQAKGLEFDRVVAGRPGRHHRPVAQGRPRPVRRHHPGHPPPGRGLRRRASAGAGLASAPPVKTPPPSADCPGPASPPTAHLISSVVTQSGDNHVLLPATTLVCPWHYRGQ